MYINILLDKFNKDNGMREKAIFASVFIIQNRLQTIHDNLKTGVTMKQWLLLVMTSVCPKPPTLTLLGELMGCSRQNVKKLASALEKKGYIIIQRNKAKASAMNIIFDKKWQDYEKKTRNLNKNILDLFFRDFSDKDIELLYKYNKKIYSGLSRIEEFAKRRKVK